MYESEFGIGLGLGVELSQGLIVESLFFYSKNSLFLSADSVRLVSGSRYSEVNENQLFNVNQYSVALDLKYGFKNSTMITPYFGGTINYTYRDYSEKRVTQVSDNLFVREVSDSHAINIGPVLGLNLEIADHFSVGVDSRLYLNAFNTNPRTEDISDSGEERIPLENISQWFIGLKMNLII